MSNNKSLWRGKPHFSYSRIVTYMMCPMKYRHSYIDKSKPLFRPAPLVFGSVFHRALAAHYNHLADFGRPQKLAVAQKQFAKDWKRSVNKKKQPPVNFNGGKSFEYRLEKGLTLLEKLSKLEPPPAIRSVETPFQIEVFDDATGEALPLPFVGVIDLLAEDEDGTPVIIEHKTAARKPGDDVLEYSHQPTVYQLAAETLGMASPKLEYQFFVQTKEPVIEHFEVTRNGASRREFFETVLAIQRGIEAGVYYKSRGWMCNDCPFAHLCTP